MTVSIEEAGTGIKEAIDDITSLRQVFAPNELPQSPNAPPFALVIPAGMKYGEDFGDHFTCTFRILVLLAPVDSKVGMDTILPLMEATGASSIPAKLNADKTLGGRADTLIVRSCSGIGTIEWGNSGASYLSTEFEVDVLL